MKGMDVGQCVEWDLKQQTSEQLQMARERLDVDANLADFGFDSIGLAQMARRLSQHYEIELTPALFFSHETLGKIGEYLLSEHRVWLERFYQEQQEQQERQGQQRERGQAGKEIANRSRGKRVQTRAEQTRAEEMAGSEEAIAIIGMSGRFPQARSVEEMWEILAEGREAVEEIPGDRFDWRKFYGEPGGEPGKIKCKWMGAIPGVGEFDPLFFEIAPREAESMDPRQRLLLEEAWKALEDAGYGKQRLNEDKVGMFVGAEQGDYQLLVGESGAGSVTANHDGILAARLGYFLNLGGPTMSINTACSSGLVAAHQACMSLRAGECGTAIVAGVNLLLTPQIYMGMSQAGMLSEDGKCYAFDQRANGMVPGEAVAVVVLKRLREAEAEGDRIYAVIRGSGINYDGKTNGITAPSGAAQARLIEETYERWRINPEQIDYIVTHGTGTRLGDPVEINALRTAFRRYTSKPGFCALTSSKSNFGHTLAASGLVSLIGLVQAMRYETIPASLHCEQENEYSEWQGSPFYINREKQDWRRKEGGKRLGAVSAFGMSGTNAHMVVEEYVAGRGEGGDVGEEEAPPYVLLVLSGKTEEALREKVREHAALLEKGEWSGQALQEMSYTLLSGRQHFGHRCAIVIGEGKDGVYLWGEAWGKEKPANLFRGTVARGFSGQKAIQQYANDLLGQSRSLHGDRQRYQEVLQALGEFYCQGYELDWEQLYGERKPRKMSLPTYPFARELYWTLVEVKGEAIANGAARGQNGTRYGGWLGLHPLVQKNTTKLVKKHDQDLSMDTIQVR
jgi:polyketide synthase PksN